MAIFSVADRVALYVHLRTFESDFDKAQGQIRAVSSAWTATVLAAVAVLITTAATPIAVPQGGQLIPAGLIDIRSDALAYLRAVVCFVGSAGVLAFWYIDQGVYQRLLHSAFAYGLFVESEEPELPQVRSSMYLANLDVTNRLGMFYRAQFWLFVVVSAVADLVGRAIGHASTDVAVWTIILGHGILALGFDLIFSHTGPSLGETIRDFYPLLASNLPVRRSERGQRRDPTSRLDQSEDPNMPAFLRRIRHQGYRYEG